MRRRPVLVTLAALTVSLVPAFAHDDDRIIGAITTVLATSLVVVDARGDSLEDLVVLEVRLVPPPSSKP